MASRPRQFLIIGAGISGLTLALSLARFGASVVVIEKQNEIRTEGAGIQLSPNARRVLNELGLEQVLDTTGFSPDALDIYSGPGSTPRQSLLLGDVVRARFGARYDVIHRGDLLDALAKACRRQNNIDINLGVFNYDIERHARGLSALFEDSEREARTLRPFAVIGADGVFSRLRTRFMDGPEAKYSGMVAWRALLPLGDANLPFSARRTSLVWAPGSHAVLYPLPNRKVINVALFSKLDLKSEAARGDLFDDPLLPEDVRKMPMIKAILDAQQSGWTYWPLYGVRTPAWHQNELGLVGDAAHAMLPFQAQGAAMGIEDAAILSPFLMTEPDAGSALRRYETTRRKRVERVQSLSARNGMIFHLPWPFSLARDLFIGMQNPETHFERLAWIYDFQAVPADKPL